MKPNGTFKSRVLAREWVTGTFLNLGSPISVELAGTAGYDWILIDHEHGPGGEDTLLHQLQAANGTPAVPIVRIAWNEPARFKRALDMGAHGVMVPLVSTAAEAKAAVSAMRYPPHGVRGVAKFHRGAGLGADFEEYYLNAHKWLLGVIQIETPAAVDNIDEIAAVDGADVLFVGPTDLSYNLGIRDQLESDKFKAALKKVSEAAKKHGKAAGILIHNAALVPMCRELGYTFMALGSDGGALRTGLIGFAQALKGK
jgi:4-hydroxy-2-oxoheptanedioate aldolase